MDDDGTPLDGFSSLFRLAGQQVPARARFVGKSIFAGLYTGSTIGLVCGQLAMWMTPYGPLVPFLLGTSGGFCMGLYGHWKQSVVLARLYARHYPEILAHAMWMEWHVLVPPSQQRNMEDWVVGQGLRQLSLAVLSAETCRPDIAEVERQERQRLVEGRVQRIEQEKQLLDSAD